MATRTVRINREAGELIAEGYGNFGDGVGRRFGSRPGKFPASEIYIRQSFRASYSVLEWCRTIRQRGDAGVFLREIRSALPMSIAFASIGIYDVARMQLRYVLECQLSFLYFRDHPREFELANSDDDVWELTRPSAVVSYLRRLPEYKNPVGLDILSSINETYGSLCKYAHPRTAVRMGLRQYITSTQPSAVELNEYHDIVKLYCQKACGLFRFASNSDYISSSEVARHILMKPIPADWRRRIEQAIAARI